MRRRIIASVTRGIGSLIGVAPSGRGTRLFYLANPRPVSGVRAGNRFQPPSEVRSVMTPHPDWWRTFFTGLAAESVRRLPFPTDAEVAFILKAAGPAAGGKILDVPCGHGRHAL